MINFYRSKSSFNSKNLTDFIDTRECVEIKKHIYSVLENDPLFHRPEGNQSLDDIRKRTHLQAKRFIDYGFFNDHRGKTLPLYYQALVTALVQYDICVLFKSTISVHFFGACIRGLGTDEQQKYFDDACDEKLSGCFALTEVAHGTDAKRMRTTATYDPRTKEFILHSEDFESAKCWIGNLGQGATHATVFAQLVTPDGKRQGLHAFVAPIRDPNTFLAYPGVLVGDMGEKIGLNGMDNGFCMFNQYRIPRENLLSKYGEVSEDGQYYSMIKDPNKRFGLLFYSLYFWLRVWWGSGP
uniref:Acyl-CoA oxidase/dehydrogenase middle domain-containing protein n=1 Tax=Cuerna arida TaxID=1464854 RepID=A0A1B6FYF3_9HEMI